jgi:hypothetical protein
MLGLVIWGFEIDTKGLLAELGSKRAVNRIAKKVHQVAAHYWHKFILPRHWQKGAKKRYDHRTRTPAYRRRKLYAFLYGTGGALGKPQAPDRDLLWSGAMKRELRKFRTIRAYPTRFSVRMHGPRYIGMRPMNTNMPNLGAEVTTVTDDEQIEVARTAEDALPRFVREEQGRRRERV